MHSSAALQLVHPSADRDLAAAEVAAAAFLRALGISLDSESLAGTPARMARGYAELFTPPTFDLTTFPNDEGYDELVISLNLPLRSVCEHHMLPFVGIAHIGYLPGARIIGLSKLAVSPSTSAAGPNARNDSPNRSPIGSPHSWRPAASAWSSRPSTAA